MNGIILLYKHNGICMHRHCAEVLSPLKYVNEPTWINSGHRIRNYQLPHRQICPQMSFKLEVMF